ncbi:IS3 family transposase domain protein [Candidatus Hepatincolaceae symbiont of Richtersius coronifer]
MSTALLYKIFVNEHGGILTIRGFSHWIGIYKKAHVQELELLSNPDGWKSKYKLALGQADEQIIRLNQRWEIDSTIADIMLNDNKRCVIVGIIDVYSRRAILHVSRTSSSEAVLGALLKAFNKWGKPEVIATDNGADFVSIRVKDSIKALGIEQEICPPFSPEKKPFIERFFKTFSHNMLTMLDGYIGHDVATRKKIESKKRFGARLFRNEDKVDLRLNREELQAFCDNWLESYYHNNIHSKLGMSPNEKVAGYLGEIYKFKSVEALSILMSPRSGDGIRTITKEGIAVDNGKYWHENLTLWIGKKVKVLFDESDWGRAYIFSLKGDFLAHAVDMNRSGFSREEVFNSMKRKQTELMSATKVAYKQMVKGATSQKELIKDMLQVRNEEDNYIKGIVDSKTKQAKVKETFELIEAAIASKGGAQLYEVDKDKEQREQEATNRYTRAKDLERQLGLGLMIPPKQEEWLKNYQETSEYSSKKFMDELAAEVDSNINIGGIQINKG